MLSAACTHHSTREVTQVFCWSLWVQSLLPSLTLLTESFDFALRTEFVGNLLVKYTSYCLSNSVKALKELITEICKLLYFYKVSRIRIVDKMILKKLCRDRNIVSCHCRVKYIANTAFSSTFLTNGSTKNIQNSRDQSHTSGT